MKKSYWGLPQAWPRTWPPPERMRPTDEQLRAQRQLAKRTTHMHPAS